MNKTMIGKHRQMNEDNVGIIDIENNRSLSRKGYVHHSGTEFSPELLGTFCSFLSEFVKDKFVVELGCGSGVLSKCCKRYIGLDANKDAGNYCEGEFIVADLTKPVIFKPPIEADLAISFDFFEHIEEDLVDVVLFNTNNMLKNGGEIFFVIDNFDELEEHITIKPVSWWQQRFKKIGWTELPIDPKFKQSYMDNMPIHWKKWLKQNYHVLFRCIKY